MSDESNQKQPLVLNVEGHIGQRHGMFLNTGHGQITQVETYEKDDAEQDLGEPHTDAMGSAISADEPARAEKRLPPT